MLYCLYKAVGFERSRFEEQAAFVFNKTIKISMTGTIKKLTDKGFGFITAEGLAKDLFFHSKNLVGVTFDELREGDTVSFETEESPKGMNAVNVQRA
jgi:CspA family cold shock protein